MLAGVTVAAALPIASSFAWGALGAAMWAAEVWPGRPGRRELCCGLVSGIALYAFGVIMTLSTLPILAGGGLGALIARGAGSAPAVV